MGYLKAMNDGYTTEKGQIAKRESQPEYPVGSLHFQSTFCLLVHFV
jgi:hypothetical protein